MQFIKNFIREDDGQGMVEYGIILGLVAVFAITALTAMGGDVAGVFDAINTQLTAVTALAAAA
jgi:pilus assembly protein Flp/PilA